MIISFVNIRILLFSFFTTVTVCSHAQKKYDWSKYEDLKFKQDAAIPLFIWGFEKGIIDPVNESKANIEIRCYEGWYNGVGNIYVMKCFDDTIVYERISGSYSSNVTLKPEDSTFYNNGGDYFDWKVEKLCINKKGDKILDSLIERKLLSMEDIKSIKEQLQNKYIKDISPDSLSFTIKPELAKFVIKMGNNFKIIDTYLIRYDGPGKFNGGYYLLGRDLYSFFIRQFDNAKIKNSYSIYNHQGFRIKH